ncbi:MAG: hypothetical protein IPF48_14885 [Sphingomonadales bacterium]|nr:hypothetical protein [Sphingomonadales bacterium]
MVERVRFRPFTHMLQATGRRVFKAFQRSSPRCSQGDLEAAKAAFAGLHVPQSTHAKSPLAKVGQALQSGDVAAAQTMMQALLDARMSKAEKPAPVAQPPQPATGISLLA